MENDIFGNLKDWGTVLDKIFELKKNHTIDAHQNGLVRILRYKQNWKLRETALECMKELKDPCSGILDEALSIMMDDTTYYDQRILAADSLGFLLKQLKFPNTHIPENATKDECIDKIIDCMKDLLDSPHPPIFHEAIEKSLYSIQSDN